MTSTPTEKISDKKFVTPDEAHEVLAETLARLGCADLAVVRNPSYIYSPVELYPLPPMHAVRGL